MSREIEDSCFGKLHSPAPHPNKSDATRRSSLSHRVMYIFKRISGLRNSVIFHHPFQKYQRKRKKIQIPSLKKIKILSLPGFESPVPSSHVGFLRMSRSFNYFPTWRKKLSVRRYFKNRSRFYGRCRGSSECCGQGPSSPPWMCGSAAGPWETPTPCRGY